MRHSTLLALAVGLLAPLPLLAQHQPVSDDPPRPSASMQVTPAGPTHREPMSITIAIGPRRSTFPRPAPSVAGGTAHDCRAERLGGAATGALIGGMIGLVVGYGTGALAIVGEESDREAAARQRRHRVGGALLGAGAGAVIGYLEARRGCVPESPEDE